MQQQQQLNDTAWTDYKVNNSLTSRQELVLRYVGLVKYVVRKMIKNYPQAIEESDLYQIGILGLSEAIERFDPAYGIKFETYAIPRIKGSIIDELRKVDWIPRSLRAKINNMKEKTVELLGDTIPVPSRFYGGLSLIEHLDIGDLRDALRDHRTKIRSRLDEIEASENPEASFKDRIMSDLDRALARAELEWIHDVLRDEALGGQ